MDPLRAATIRLAHSQPQGSKLRRDLLAALKEGYETGDRERDGWNPGEVIPSTPWPDGTGSQMPPARDLKGDQLDNPDYIENHFSKEGQDGSLRSEAIRLASTLPKGSAARLKLLAALK